MQASVSSSNSIDMGNGDLWGFGSRFTMDSWQCTQLKKDSNGFKFVSISTYVSHYAGLTEDGKTYTWGTPLAASSLICIAGEGGYQRLGHNSTASENHPRRVEFFASMSTPVTQVCCCTRRWV